MQRWTVAAFAALRRVPWGSRAFRLSLVGSALAVALLASVGTAGAQAFPPQSATDEGGQIRDLYMALFVVVAVIFVVVEAVIVFILVRYRRRSDALPSQTHGHQLAELLWTGIPLVIVMAFFAVSLVVLDDLESAPADDSNVETIDVQGIQWNWAFRYSVATGVTTASALVDRDLSGDATLEDLEVSDASGFREFQTVLRIDTEHLRVRAIAGNTLTVERAIEGTVAQRHPVDSPVFVMFNGTETREEGRLETRASTPVVTVPAGRTVRFNLASTDVIHSFYTPQFLYKLDVVPGRIHSLWLTVTEPGFYEGQCAEFCGSQHGRMIFTVNALAPADYDAWFEERAAAALAAVAAPPPAPSEPAEEDGAAAVTGDPAHGQELFFANGCNLCHGDQGQGGLGSTIASTGLTLEQVIQQYRDPRDQMPRFPAEAVPDEDVADIYAWLQTLPLPETIVEGLGTP